MFSRMTNRLLTVFAAALLVTVAVGCSDNGSPVAPMTDNEAIVNKAPIGSRGDNNQDFAFTGVIAKVEQSERVVEFADGGPMVLIDKEARARILPGQRETQDVFNYLEAGKRVTVYGTETRDERYRAVITTVEIKRDLSDFETNAF